MILDVQVASIKPLLLAHSALANKQRDTWNTQYSFKGIQTAAPLLNVCLVGGF